MNIGIPTQILVHAVILRSLKISNNTNVYKTNITLNNKLVLYLF